MNKLKLWWSTRTGGQKASVFFPVLAILAILSLSSVGVIHAMNRTDPGSTQANAPVTTSATGGATASANGTADANPAVQAVCKSGTYAISKPASNASTSGEGEKLFKDGFTPVRTASNADQAKAALLSYIQAAKTDTRLLQNAVSAYLGQTVDQSSLESNGCATDTAIKLVSELTSTVNSGTAKANDVAPSDGYNTGLTAGKVNSVKGVSGNEDSRKAVSLVTSTGKKVYLMARCGNTVTPEQPAPTTTPSPTPSPSHSSTPCGCETTPPTTTPPTHTHTPTPTPTPTPTKTPCGCETTPPTTTPPTPTKSTVYVHPKNDVDQAYVDPYTGLPKDSTANVTLDYTVGSASSATITVTAQYGTYDGGNPLRFTVSGSGSKTVTYMAPSEVPAGGKDTITVTISDSNGSATSTTTITINPKSADGSTIPNG